MAQAEKVLVNGGYPLHTYEDVEEKFSLYISSQSDKERIRKAYDFIIKKHDGQLRKSGEPYYHHLVEVAYILADLHSGPDTIISGFLHDVVEDTDVTVEDIQKGWGNDVAKIVDALTKIQRLKLSRIDKEEFEAEDHRKIFLGMAKDIRVILIKLADRLHNMRTLASLAPERQQVISKETMEVFAPIAHRLGLDTIKSELEDLCLKYLEPERYYEVKKLLSKKQKTMVKSLESLKKKIADILFEHNMPFEISSRVKSIYSIYRKMYIKGHPFDEIYDILALRIITKTEIQCYEILGLIHKTYTPVPGRFKDYIATPKNNLYQSLHTTIIGGDGNFYEIQIRTEEMDEVAESGIAAHWAYKEGNGYNSEKEQREIENKLHWFRDMVSMSSEANDEKASEFMESLTHDIFEANVYVFSPKGRVVELPQGSTPVDFAYRIHTKVGDTCVGALVNRVMVPLNTVLKTGDLVEIKTNKNSTPNEDWLEFVKSSAARSAIKKYVAKKNAELLRDDKIAKGKQSAGDAFKDRGVSEEDMMKYLEDPKLLEHFGFDNVDDLFVGIANHKPAAGAIVEYLKIKRPVNIPTGSWTRGRGNDDCPVYCKGVGKIAIALANCCTPIPGDDIVGYITKGKGITVHRNNCPNVMHENVRLVDVYWRDDLEFATYPVDILIKANDRNNLLVDIMSALAVNKTTINNLHAHLTNSNLDCFVTLTIFVSDSKRLNDLFSIIKSVKGVYEVTRVIH